MEEINSQTGVSALQFMNLTANDDDDEYLLRPRALCRDGFSISIQGGTRFHYCQPRELCRIFESVELGFPNQVEDLIMPYIDGSADNPLGNVYGFVPIEVVDEMITKHGGIVDVDANLDPSNLAYYERCREEIHEELVKIKETKQYD